MGKGIKARRIYSYPPERMSITSNLNHGPTLPLAGSGCSMIIQFRAAGMDLTYAILHPIVVPS